MHNPPLEPVVIESNLVLIHGGRLASTVDPEVVGDGLGDADLESLIRTPVLVSYRYANVSLTLDSTRAVFAPTSDTPESYEAMTRGALNFAAAYGGTHGIAAVGHNIKFVVRGGGAEVAAETLTRAIHPDFLAALNATPDGLAIGLPADDFSTSTRAQLAYQADDDGNAISFDVNFHLDTTTDRWSVVDAITLSDEARTRALALSLRLATSILEGG